MKVLVVGMLDSVHLARWISQFSNSDFEIRVFPSTYFRKPHNKLLELNSENIRVLGLSSFGLNLGYLDSIITLRFLSNRIGLILRKFYLQLFLHYWKPEVIHALEIQHAGYLVSTCRSDANKKILTNWGSDIYYFQAFPNHRISINKSLLWATHYSAECARDYALAKDLGFKGIELEKIPNAGGFDLSHRVVQSHFLGNQLIVKCYGGQFGLGSLAIRVCYRFLQETSSARVFMYSVTDDLLDEVRMLEKTFPNRVRFSSIRNPMSHESILNEFENSRVYLGLSKSDGLSTSFLEAIVSGAYPIQSSTSCAAEIIELGAEGRVVEPEFNAILSALNSVYLDEECLLRSRAINRNIARRFLDYNRIQEIALTYYK